MWRALRAHRLAGLQFRRQAPCGPYIADFLCHAARLAIEVDGATHSTEAEIAHDRRRDTWFATRGWRVLRFRNDEVYNNFDGVIETILAHLPETPSPTLPRSAGEGADTQLHEGCRSRTFAVPSPAERGREREGAESLHES